MKLLLTHRFFWPDTAPYAVMLRAIGDALAEAGHEVHVLSSMPSYRSQTRPNDTPPRETLGALHVRRIRVFGDEKRNPLRRLANVALYCWALFITILRLRPDVVTASTFPPVVAAWSASLAARIVGAKFIYHMQDIHPELSVYNGGRLGRGFAMRLMRWLDNQTLRRSATIIVLSQDMADTLAERRLGPLPVHIINNFSLDLFGEAEDPPAELRKRTGCRRVIFAGNLGRFQNLQQMAEGVSLLFPEFSDLELFFLGDGEALQHLKRRWEKHKQVRFAPFLHFAQAKALIEEADVGLVSLQKDIYRVAFPSKIATYLALGTPVLAAIEPNSNIARHLEASGVGIVPKEQSAKSIADALRQILSNPPSQSHVRESYSHFSNKEKAFIEWSNLVGGAKDS